jgi:SAM-dependent methyltransferase
LDATAYYRRNAKLHGSGGELSQVVRTGRLPESPSEMDWAIHWLLSGRARLKSCLDVGCGPLRFLRSVAERCDECWGVDIADHDLWAAHAQIHTQVCNLDQGSLPFEDQTFEAVVMLMVLEHVFNPFHAVRELRRVCHAEGRAVIGVPNLAGIRNRLWLLLGRLPVTSARFSFDEDAWDGYHLHQFTQVSLAWLLQREGLQPLAWASAGRLQALKRLRPSLFGGDLIVLCSVSEPRPGLRLAL